MRLPLTNYTSLKNYYHTIDAGELLLALMVRVEKLPVTELLFMHRQKNTVTKLPSETFASLKNYLLRNYRCKMIS
jgi:hypothetical protein